MNLSNPPLPYSLSNSRLEINTTFIKRISKRIDPQSVEFSIKIFPNSTNYEILNNDSKTLLGYSNDL